MKRSLLCAALILMGCTSFGEPYWEETQPVYVGAVQVAFPLEVSRIVYRDWPCDLISQKNTPMLGCANFATQTIEIKKGMSPGLTQCVISHEKKHFAGFSHSLERPHYSTDCGDGTML